jgi:hypothetical protein
LPHTGGVNSPGASGYSPPMQSGMLRLSTVLVLVVLAGISARAHAQHGTAGWSVMPMDPRSSVMLELQTAEFNLPGRAGVWQTWSPRFEHVVLPWLSWAVRPGVARVDYDDGESAFGLADTELVAKARIASIRALHASVSAGLSGELPTGDADTGTGNGHVSLFPFATFATMPSRVFMLHVMAGDRIVLGDAAHAVDAVHAGHAGHGGAAGAAHGSVIMPHQKHELTVHTGACFTLAPIVISPGLEWMQVLSSGQDTLLTAQLELALVPRRELRLAAGLDLPLLDTPRFEWRTRLMAALLW